MIEHTSPFKFLDAYQAADRAVFFGRNQEAIALYDALSGVKHLLVYGPSGAGKTSLIECGLRSQFSAASWFALTIRRGKNMNASVFAKLQQALEEKLDLDTNTGLPMQQDVGFEQAVEQLFEERFQSIYLLFDQFEELLILGSQQEKERFFIQLHRLLNYRIPCRVLLIMREEFIGHLSEFEHLCPSIFQHRFRLEKMRRFNVRSVILNMLETPTYSSFFKVKDSEALSDSILSKLPDHRREIELTHVQVFLEELWNRAQRETATGAVPILNKDLLKEEDKLERVLDLFLKKQLKALEKIYGENIPLEVLATMISKQHTKLQMSLADLQKRCAAKQLVFQSPLPQLLQDLAKRRIVRTLQSEDQTHYELSHDLLAFLVGQNLTEEMKLREKANDIYELYQERQGYFSKEDLDYLRPFQLYQVYPALLEQRIEQSHQKIETEQVQKQQKQRRFILFLFTLSLILFTLSIYAFNAKTRAENAEDTAQAEAFQAKILVADKLKVQGEYEEALNFLENMTNAALSEQQASTLLDRQNTFAQLAKKVSLSQSLWADTNYLAALQALQFADSLSTDEFIKGKIQQLQQDRQAAIDELFIRIKRISTAGQRSASDLKNAIRYYEMAQRYQPEQEIRLSIQDSIQDAILEYKKRHRGEVLDAVVEGFLSK